MSWQSPSAPETASSVEEFFKHWLRGTTCGNKKLSIAWHSECGNFVLLKHGGHGESWGYGSGYCGTYYALYDIRLPYPDVLGNPTIAKWEGRWTKAKQAELETIVVNYEMAK